VVPESYSVIILLFPKEGPRRHPALVEGKTTPSSPPLLKTPLNEEELIFFPFALLLLEMLFAVYQPTPSFGGSLFVAASPAFVFFYGRRAVRQVGHKVNFLKGIGEVQSFRLRVLDIFVLCLVRFLTTRGVFRFCAAFPTSLFHSIYRPGRRT